MKSLDERIDDLADDMRDMKAQVAALNNGLSALQAQLAVLTARLESVTEELRRTNAKLDVVTARLDALAVDFAAFKARTENSFSLVRWVGVFMAGALLSMVGGAVLIARSAGALEATVQQQQKVLEEIRRDVGELKLKVK